MAEPIELYLRFDKDFFTTKRADTSGEEREAEIEAMAGRYRELLEGNQRLLNQVLRNEREPEELGREFYERKGGYYEGLSGLGRVEKVHGTWINKLLEEGRLLEGYGYERLDKKRRGYVNGRTAIHLVRLLRPKEYCIILRVMGKEVANNFCSAFGRDYLEYVAGLKPKDEFEGGEITERIGAEGLGVFGFWTIAPYVYGELRQRGESLEESMGKMFEWIKRGKKGFDFYPEGLPYFWQGIGIRELERPLGYDERMPSHLRARLLAKVVVREAKLVKGERTKKSKTSGRKR